MNRLSLPIILGTISMVMVLSACQSAEHPAPAPVPSVTVSENALTPEEQAEGWELLFDGNSIDHWRGFQRQDVPGGWVVTEEGELHFSGEGERGDIITRQQYESFDLSLEWKIAEAGNSGIFYHVTEDHERVWYTGPEYQILDNDAHPDAQRGGNRLAGANYDMHAPSADVVKPVGEWNHARIVVHGNHVEHWLNGHKIVEFEVFSPEWEELLANSKFAELPDYGRTGRGHIALQDHSDPVWFRNIKIRQL